MFRANDMLFDRVSRALSFGMPVCHVCVFHRIAVPHFTIEAGHTGVLSIRMRCFCFSCRNWVANLYRRCASHLLFPCQIIRPPPSSSYRPVDDCIPTSISQLSYYSVRCHGDIHTHTHASSCSTLMAAVLTYSVPTLPSLFMSSRSWRPQAAHKERKARREREREEEEQRHLERGNEGERVTLLRGFLTC